MKRVIFIFLCLCLIFTGCTKYKNSGDITAVTSNLSFVAKITVKDISHNYSVVIDKDGTVNMESLAKDENGIDFTFVGTTVSYKYKALEYFGDISSIPKSSYTDFIPAVFWQLEKTDKLPKFRNDQYYISDRTEKYSFTVYLGQTGLPLKIVDRDKNITVEIKSPALIS